MRRTNSRVRRHLYHNQIVKEHQRQTSPGGSVCPCLSDRQGSDSLTSPIGDKSDPCPSASCRANLPPTSQTGEKANYTSRGPHCQRGKKFFSEVSQPAFVSSPPLRRQGNYIDYSLPCNPRKRIFLRIYPIILPEKNLWTIHGRRMLVERMFEAARNSASHRRAVASPVAGVGCFAVHSPKTCSIRLSSSSSRSRISSCRDSRS